MIKSNVRLNSALHQAFAYVDSGQIKQALLNVAINAIEAMKLTGGELRIESRQTSDTVEILIRDTGNGIPKDKLIHIFDPFYTDKETGAGLGLAITYSIIEKNNGKIVAASIPGKGSTFTISLPCR